MEKHEYEKSVTKFNKWCSLIETVVGRNITFFQKNN